MIETQQLLLRTWRDEDLDLLLEMQRDPETMRYMADGHCPDRGECAEAIEQIESHRCEHGFGIWAAEIRATGELVGWVGLTTPGWLPEVMPAVEVGYLFGRAHWGQGSRRRLPIAACDLVSRNSGSHRSSVSTRKPTQHLDMLWRSWACERSRKPATQGLDACWR